MHKRSSPNSTESTYDFDDPFLLVRRNLHRNISVDLGEGGEEWRFLVQQKQWDSNYSEEYETPELTQVHRMKNKGC